VTDHGSCHDVTGDAGVVWHEAAVLGDVIKGHQYLVILKGRIEIKEILAFRLLQDDKRIGGKNRK
jgi:hypothetical protein